MASELPLVALVDNERVRISVSSTLDRASSKRFLCDGNDDTCWSSAIPKVTISRPSLPHTLTSTSLSLSQPNTPTTITLLWPHPHPGVLPRRIEFTFQGGFVGRTVSVFCLTAAAEWSLLTQVFPLDINANQSFDLPSQGDTPVHSIRLVFENGSDLNYGRIVLYRLQILGLEPTSAPPPAV
ncbi:galactose-binding like protein [Auriculariales sp. MPI-PUGE-AT-0066]|nr:galactose-binding like protein [Auriculariales sp. MPI-PUGE-AT-0066]